MKNAPQGSMEHNPSPTKKKNLFLSALMTMKYNKMLILKNFTPYVCMYSFSLQAGTKTSQTEIEMKKLLAFFLNLYMKM